MAVPRPASMMARRTLPVIRTVGSIALVAASIGIGGPGDRATARQSLVTSTPMMVRAAGVARTRREPAGWAIGA